MKILRNVLAGILCVIIVLTFNIWIWIISILAFAVYEIDKNMMLKEIARMKQEHREDTR